MASLRRVLKLKIDEEKKMKLINFRDSLDIVKQSTETERLSEMLSNAYETKRKWNNNGDI